jgi:hypothetical protein
MASDRVQRTSDSEDDDNDNDNDNDLDQEEMAAPPARKKNKKTDTVSRTCTPARAL